jgi:hypothetical protein
MPWTFGDNNQGAAMSPNWVHPADLNQVRVFPPRIRGDLWVEDGHIESADPYTDTRED